MSYPPIKSDNLLPLKQLRQRLKEDPTLLERPECPYPPEDRDWLRVVLMPKAAAQAVEMETIPEESLDDPATWDEMARKIRRVYAQLEGLEEDADIGEKVQIIKTKAALLDRLTTLGEKVVGHRKVAEFQRMVLSVLDDVFTPDQRTEVMARLGEYK